MSNIVVSPSRSSRVAEGDILPFSGLESTAERVGSLPCLNSYISNEICDDWSKSALSRAGHLSVQHRRSAFVLSESVGRLSRIYGLSCLGFLTLTFRDHVLDPREAQRRLNSLLTGVVNRRYRSYLGVFERQKSGRIHYHFLVVLPSDIRTGFDFAGIANHDYSSASKALRAEWAFWRRKAPTYGFGRTELLPVRSSTEAIAKYVGKYIAKNIDARRASQDKGVRLVRYARNARAGTTRFQFNSAGGKEWRRKLAIFAGIVNADNPAACITDIGDFSRVLGPNWAYLCSPFVYSLGD